MRWRRDRPGALGSGAPRARPAGPRFRRLARALRPVAREPASDVERGGVRRCGRHAGDWFGVEGRHGDSGGGGRRREPQPHLARGGRRIGHRSHRPTHPRRYATSVGGPPHRGRPHGRRGRVRSRGGKERRSRVGGGAGMEDRAHRSLGVPVRRRVLVPSRLRAGCLRLRRPEVDGVRRLRGNVERGDGPRRAAASQCPLPADVDRRCLRRLGQRIWWVTARRTSAQP